MSIVFWTAAALTAWVYVGYPLFLFLVSRVFVRPVRKADVEPTVTMIVAAYNEERVIAAKLENSLALDYPPDKLEILVASDGSTDGMERVVREQFAGRVRLLALPRAGKTAAQNRAAAAATGEILVFSDASTMYDAGAVRAMVRSYADPAVGSVGGDVRYVREGEEVAGKGRQLYWNYEASLRRWESQIYSVIGGTGCIYSLRKSLYEDLDPAAISDFVQPARALLRGYRSVVEDDAACYEVAESTELGEELQRRARVALRGLRGLGYMTELLNPFRHPWLALELVSHRLLRWSIPFLLVVLFVSNAFLLDRPLFQLVFALQVTFYGAALLALLLDRLRVRLPGVFVPLYFCVINLAPMLAVWRLLKGEKKVLWETGPAKPAA